MTVRIHSDQQFDTLAEALGPHQSRNMPQTARIAPQNIKKCTLKCIPKHPSARDLQRRTSIDSRMARERDTRRPLDPLKCQFAKPDHTKYNQRCHRMHRRHTLSSLAHVHCLLCLHLFTQERRANTSCARSFTQLHACAHGVYTMKHA